MWMVDYGATWIKFYKVDTHKSMRFVSPTTPRLFFYLLEKVFKSEGVKKNESLILGFPGVVKNGKIYSAPNLDERAWKGVNLLQRLQTRKLNAHVINDTDLHGHLLIKGRGTELVIALGTGFGSSLYTDGLLLPNTEVGLHPLSKGKTYEELLNYKAFLRSGKPLWIKNLKIAIQQLTLTFNPDRIYLTGSMAPHLQRQRLPKMVKVADYSNPSKKVLKGLRLS
jgi:polyphosphate glucokinase